MLAATRQTFDRSTRDRVSTRLLLARHGETDWNQRSRWQGQRDIPLNGTGRNQALALSAALRKEQLAAVYSSTLQRAVETAQMIAKEHKLNVCRDERFNETYLGAWEGLTRKEIGAAYPQLLQAWDADPRSVTPPNGESISAVEQRILAALQEIARAYPGESVCLIGHKFTNGIIRSHYLGLPLVEALSGVLAQGTYEVIAIPHPLWG
jgi:broad specificity phosphatase PhoE